MPPKVSKEVVPAILPDVPYQYLSDRSQWSDLKRSLNICGLTWNFPDWMCTVVYMGPDYKEMRDSSPNAKKELDEIFAPPTHKVGEVDVKVSETSKKYTKLLGLTPALGEYVQPSVNIATSIRWSMSPIQNCQRARKCGRGLLDACRVPTPNQDLIIIWFINVSHMTFVIYLKGWSKFWKW